MRTPGQQKRRAAHALHSARDDEVRVAGANALRREHHRLQPGPADHVRGVCRGRVGDAREQCRLPRRCLTDAGLHHVAHDDVFDLLRVRIRALERLRDRDRAEFRGREFGQPAEELADRRSHRGKDECVHVRTSCEVKRVDIE